MQGLVRSRQERWDEADRLFDAALVLAHRMPFPLAEGRILLAWAEMETRRGHPADAEQLLRKAQAIFRRLGAPLYEERAERALAAFALNSQPSTQDVAT